MTDTVSGEPSLAGKAGRALGWSLLNTLVSRFGTFAIGIALARVLGPSEFGTFAVALVALLAVLSFNELGVSLAIVRWPGDPRPIAATVMTISLISSTLLFAVCFAGAPAFAQAMGAPAAAPVVRLLAVTIVISGLVATPAALLQREFKAGRRMIIDQVSNWGSALVSIGAALMGMGAMSLAVGRLAGATASAVLFLVFSPHRVLPGFDRDVARRLLRFGLPLAGSSIVVFMVTYVDQLMVGTVLGSTALGFYVLAFNLSNWPVNVFSQPVRQVAPAAFARLHGDPPTMRWAFGSALGLLSAVTLPVCLLICGAAPPIIRFVYGSAWENAAQALVWLGLLAGLRILFELFYDYFVVLGSSRVVFTVQLVWLVVLAPAVYLGSTSGGIGGAALAQVAVALLIILPLYLWELRRVEIRAGSLARQVAVPLAAAAGAGGVAFAAAHLISIDLAALAVAGVAMLAALALQLRRIKAIIKRLKEVEA